MAGDRILQMSGYGNSRHARRPQTHDYTNPGWGHDYIFEPVEEGLKGNMMGWGHGLKNGDYLLLKNGNSSTRYKIESVEYLGNPPDMWKAKVRFYPRTETHPTKRYT